MAGDDTILVISRDPQGGEALAKALLDLTNRRPGDAVRNRAIGEENNG